MPGQTFAFQLARPLDVASGEQGSLDAQYDAQTQSLLWQGQTRAQAVTRYCTAHHNGYWNCSTDGVNCSNWGAIRVTGGYVCDAIVA